MMYSNFWCHSNLQYGNGPNPDGLPFLSPLHRRRSRRRCTCTSQPRQWGPSSARRANTSSSSAASLGPPSRYDARRRTCTHASWGLHQHIKCNTWKHVCKRKTLVQDRSTLTLAHMHSAPTHRQKEMTDSSIFAFHYQLSNILHVHELIMFWRNKVKLANFSSWPKRHQNQCFGMEFCLFLFHLS